MFSFKFLFWVNTRDMECNCNLSMINTTGVCYRRNYITEPVNIDDMVERQNLFSKRLKPKKVSCIS